MRQAVSKFAFTPQYAGRRRVALIGATLTVALLASGAAPVGDKQVVAADPVLPISATTKKASASGAHGVLEPGSKGMDVWQAQQRLLSLGYYLPAANGVFDFDMEQAIWAIQKTAGIERTGVLDEATQKLLDAGVVPESRKGLKRGVEIDIDRQILMTVEDGVVTRIFNASSGSGERFVGADGVSYPARTAPGNYSVYFDRNYNHESTLGVGDMYRPKYFNGAVSVHGAPEIPPYPASHGCVRVSNPAMDWLWDVWGFPMRTPVVVY